MGFEVRRLIRLAVDRAFFAVREEVENTGKLGRIYNMVQHPTIGPPFLDETTVVDASITVSRARTKRVLTGGLVISA